jgi:hypothetical protein
MHWAESGPGHVRPNDFAILPVAALIAGHQTSGAGDRQPTEHSILLEIRDELRAVTTVTVLKNKHVLLSL